MATLPGDKILEWSDYVKQQSATQPAPVDEGPSDLGYIDKSVGYAVERPTTGNILEYGWNVKGITDLGKLKKIGQINGWWDYGENRNGEYLDVEELYGEDFKSLSTEERRARINEINAARDKADYLSVLAYGEDNSLLAGATGFIGTLATPTTLIPGLSFAKYGAKGMAVTSALFGAEYDLLQQYADKGDIDMGQFATTTAVAGGIGLGLGVTASKLVKFFGNAEKGGQLSRGDIQAKADEIQEIYFDAVENDIPIEQLHEYTKQRLGVTSDELVQIVTNAENKPVVPANKAEVAEARKIASARVDAYSISGDPNVNRIITPIIDGFSRIDEKLGLSNLLKNKVNGYFFKSYINAMDRINAINPMTKLYKKLSAEDKRVLDDLLLNSDEKALADAKKILQRYDDKADDIFENYRTQLREQGNKLRESGYNVPENDYFIPRVVKDHKGLQRYLNKDPEVKSTVEKALEDRAQVLGVSKSEISEADRDFIVSNILRGLRVGSNKKNKQLYAVKKARNNKRERFLSARKIAVVNKDMQKFYENPMQATIRYFQDSSKLIEKNNFFGKSAINKEMGLNYAESKKGFLGELALKGMDTNTEVRLQSMLDAIFVDAEKASNGFVSGYKNLVTASYLANPMSALTQLGDIPLGAWQLGIKNTIKGIFNKEIDIVKDLGIDQIDYAISETLSSGFSMARGVDKLLELTQFKRIDRAGKTSIVNAAWKKVQQQVKTPKGVAELKERYGTSYGPEFTTFVRDVRNKRITPLTKEYLLNELAEFQPINPAGMPEAALKNPNGRIMYTLQSFTVKQLSLIRKNIVDEVRRGNSARRAGDSKAARRYYTNAIKNATSFAMLVPPSNMAIEYGKERILGKDPDLKDNLVQRYASNALKLFGTSEYAVNRLAKTGKLGDFVIDLVAPPTQMFDGYIKTASKAIADGEFDPAMFKQTPVVGQLLYYYVFGGLEKWQDQQDKKEARERQAKYGISGD